MFKKMITSTGEEHGLMNEVGNSVQDNDFKYFKPKDKEKAEALRKEEKRVVKARYINHRGQTERLDKVYMRWAGDPIQSWHFIPNEVYEVPLGLVNEVNSNPGLPKRSEILGRDGLPTKKDEAFRIHEFVPIGF